MQRISNDKGGRKDFSLEGQLVLRGLSDNLATTIFSESSKDSLYRKPIYSHSKA